MLRSPAEEGACCPRLSYMQQIFGAQKTGCLIPVFDKYAGGVTTSFRVVPGREAPHKALVYFGWVHRPQTDGTVEYRHPLLGSIFVPLDTEVDRAVVPLAFFPTMVLQNAVASGLVSGVLLHYMTGCVLALTVVPGLAAASAQDCQDILHALRACKFEEVELAGTLYYCHPTPYAVWYLPPSWPDTTLPYTPMLYAPPPDGGTDMQKVFGDFDPEQELFGWEPASGGELPELITSLLADVGEPPLDIFDHPFD